MPSTARTVATVLAECGLTAAEARILLAHVLQLPRERLIAAPDSAVAAAAVARFDDLVRRRRAGEPVAYLIGAREFYGRRFRVDASVLVPRPETESLIDAALGLLRGCNGPRLLDLGTGSGCIGITLALERPDARVVAVDRSREALAIARANARDLGAAVEWIESDWAERVEGPFDMIVSNPPYVADGDPHLEALRHEPSGALTAGPDGLSALRRIVSAAPGLLRARGVLLVEHGHDQGAAVRDLFAQAGFDAIATRRDLAGTERICSGRRGGSGGD